MERRVHSEFLSLKAALAVPLVLVYTAFVSAAFLSASYSLPAQDDATHAATPPAAQWQAGHVIVNPAVRFDRRTQQRIMAAKRRRHRVGLLFPTLRAALDIGKEQRYGPARKRGS